MYKHCQWHLHNFTQVICRLQTSVHKYEERQNKHPDMQGKKENTDYMYCINSKFHFWTVFV